MRDSPSALVAGCLVQELAMQNSIDFFEQDGKIVVRMIENDVVTTMRFKYAVSAYAWANGQCARLNLPPPNALKKVH